jgi:hypothetical protein
MIYLIYCPEFTPLDSKIVRVKIGVTVRDVESRMSDLQTGSPCKIELLRVIPAFDSLETKLHRFLSESHVHGEWFDLNKETLDILISSNESEINEWIDDSTLNMSLRNAGRIFLIESQYTWFCEFLNFYPDLESVGEVIISLGYVKRDLWSHMSCNDIEKRLFVLLKRMENFLKIEIVEQRGNSSAGKDYKVKWSPKHREKERIDSFYDKMFESIDSEPDLLKNLESLLTGPQYFKIKSLIQGFPTLIKNGELVRTTAEIKKRVRGVLTNNVFEEFSKISKKTKLFTIEKVLVKNGKVIQDIFGDEEETAVRGGRGRPRYVRFIWGVKDNDFRKQ